MTVVASHEETVRHFYDDAGEGAARAYDQLMGRMWFHGDRIVEEQTGSPHEARLALLRWMADQATLTRGAVALEFGPGTGGAATELAAMTGAVIIGCGNVESTNNRARQLAAERGLSDRAVFVTVGDRDYQHLAAWPTASLDALVFMESVCHLPNQPAFFDAAFRVLRAGGRLVGLDWIQRPFGIYRTPEQIAEIIDPVVHHFRLAGLGTPDSYAQMMRDAGFTVELAADEYPDQHCYGSTEPVETWRDYQGPSTDLHSSSKTALDRARAAGVFSVARWVATRPTD